MRYLLLLLVCFEAAGQDLLPPISPKQIDLINKLIDPKYVDKMTIDFPEWEPDSEYYRDDLVNYNGKTYVAQDDNTNANPSTSPGKEWSLYVTYTIEDQTINLVTSGIEDHLRERFSHMKDSTGRIHINKRVHFVNCEIQFLELNNMSFEGLSFSNCKINHISFNNTVSRRLSIDGGDGKELDLDYSITSWSLGTGYYFSNKTIKISDCTLGEVSINNLVFANSNGHTKSRLHLDRSTIGSLSIVNPQGETEIRIRHCDIKCDRCLTEEFFFIGHALNSTNNEPANLEIQKTTFGAQHDTTFASIQGVFKQIVIDSCLIHSRFDFFNTSVAERFHLTHNKFNNSISINNSTFPGDIKMRWEQLRGSRLSKFTRESQFKSTFIGSEGDGIEIIDHFEDLMRSYQILYANYKIAGDLESANECYAEMKDTHTKRLKYLYTEDRSFKTYFRWKLSQLMKVYTDHGTDPARAIVKSIWVIVCFAIFYFFFPSDWDITSKSQLMQNYKDFAEKNEKGYVKPFFVLALGFLISLINALTLSLNSFTTLGFGNIPTRGIAKYFCVLEGFIGWFLLSIFTVALINQVLG